MLDNIIQYWADLITEEENIDENRFRHDPSTSPTYGRGRVGISRPDEFGQKISHIVNPLKLQGKDGDLKDIWDADLSINVTDRAWLKNKYRDANFDGVGEGLLIYFMSKAGSLNPERILEFFNSACGSILPRKYTVDDMKYLGVVDTSGTRGNVKKDSDLYIINFTDKIGDKVQTSSKEKDMINALTDAQKNNEDAEMTFQSGKKVDFEKYFRKGREEFDKLDSNSSYMFIFSVSGKLDTEKIAEITGAEPVLLKSDLRKPVKAGGFGNFDVFAIKIA